MQSEANEEEMKQMKTVRFVKKGNTGEVGKREIWKEGEQGDER